MNLSFRQIVGRQIDLTTGDGSPVATYRFDPDLPKPCFHPLITAAGKQIAAFQPSDHIWHRGLWFAIKFINQSNFWEENPPFGIQKTVSQPTCNSFSADSVQITHQLQWTSEATKSVIDETRKITFAVLPGGIRCIDWRSILIALQDLLLDRTPYNNTWGGYSGLTFRASLDAHDTSYLLPNGQSTPAIIGQPHPWALFRSSLGPDTNSKFSLGIISHPSNPRTPQIWYAKSGQHYDFMNTAFLFHEPMSLSRGHRLDFHYRVLYRDGWWTVPEFNALAQNFTHPKS